MLKLLCYEELLFFSRILIRMKHKHIAIVLALLCGIVIYTFNHATTAHNKSEQQLISANTNIRSFESSADNVFEPSYAKQAVSEIENNCEENSRMLSLTRLYDCHVSYTFSYLSKSPVDTAQTRAKIESLVKNKGVQSSDVSDNMAEYDAAMKSYGDWQEVFYSPDSGIGGVSQTNSYGGEGLANITFKISSRYSSTDRTTIRLEFAVSQKYDSCKSYFLPCDHRIAK